jgi:ABC transporter substrate binding protein
MLMPVSAEDAAGNIEAFQQRLAALGYIDGKNINIERRYTDGRTGRVTALAAELVGLQPDIIVTWGTPAAMAAKNATITIPIVMAAATDPVESGLIASLARPGRFCPVPGAHPGVPRHLSGSAGESELERDDLHLRCGKRGWLHGVEPRSPRRARLVRDLHGALADERDGHRMGAHAVARDATGGVGGAEEAVFGGLI